MIGFIVGALAAVGAFFAGIYYGIVLLLESWFGGSRK